MKRTCERCGEELSGETTSCPRCDVLAETVALRGWDATTRRIPRMDDEGNTRTQDKPRHCLWAFGDYEVLGEIAKGGMGVVYRARQVSLRRLVALKMILPSIVPDEEALQRFRVEEEAVARLDHPNIVPIYEVGSHEGRPFFTMKLVEGGSLAGQVERFMQDQRAAAQLIATVARAVEYAHQRGVLHRDLKPGNVLVDEDEVPYLTDFGLAKHVHRDSSLTLSGMVIGTPAFMAPEQAAGNTREVTTAADTYSLGAMLYLLLAGRPPFQSEMSLEVLRRVVEEEPDRPNSINRHVDRDLETICLKCLEKAPSRRYRSAQALAEELERWLRGEPILARPSTTFEQFVKWARRKPAIAALSGGLAAALIAGLAGVVWQWREAEDAREVAEERADLATRAREESDRQRVRAEDARTRLELKNAEDLFERGDTPKAIQALVAILRREPRHEIASQRLFSALMYRNFVLPETNVLHHSRWVTRVRFHPDGQKLVAASLDQTAYLWQAPPSSDQSPILLRHHGSITDAQFSPDGQWLATASRDRTVRLWDADDGSPRGGPLSFPSPVSHLAFAPLGDWLAVATAEGMVSIRGVRDGARRAEIILPGGTPRWIGFDPATSRLAMADGEQILVWNWQNEPAQVHRLSGASMIWTGAFSPSGQWLAAGCRSDGSVLVWNLHRPGEEPIRLQHRLAVNSVQFSPDGHSLLTASRDGTARLWSTTTWRQVVQPMRHHGAVSLARFSRDGTLIATGCQDGTARLWNTASGLPATEFLRTPGPVVDLDFGQADVVTIGSQAGNAGITTMWHVASPAPTIARLKHDAAVKAVLADPDGQWIASGDEAGRVTVWNGRTLSPEMTHQLEAPIRSLTLLGDSAMLAVHCEDGAVHFKPLSKNGAGEVSEIPIAGCRSFSANLDGKWMAWVTEQGTLHVAKPGLDGVREFTVGGDRLSQCVLNPRGSLVAGMSEKAVWVWDTESGQPVATALPHEGYVLLARFDSENRKLLTAAWDLKVRIWNLPGGEPAGHPFIHPARITDAVLSEDGAWLATGAEDGVLRVWNPLAGTLAWADTGHGPAIHQLALPPDGQRVCASYLDGSVRFFDLRTGSPRSERFLAAEKAPRVTLLCGGQMLGAYAGANELLVFPVPTLPRGFPRRLLNSVDRVLGGSAGHSEPGSNAAITGEEESLRELWHARTARPHQMDWLITWLAQEHDH
jgi:eukaryotic-like serine/threonine-protein kinase